MSDLEDMDVDEFADQVADLVEDRVDVPEPEVPDVPDDIPDTETVQEIAGATVQDQLEHLVNEDCDTAACNRLRDEFGIDPSGDGGADESDTEGDENESETGEGNDESSQSSETEGDESQSGDGDEAGGDAPENAAFPDEF